MIDEHGKVDSPKLPTPLQVEEQLARIVRSGEFQLPQRGTSFLTFVVNETLAGRGSYLKAFTIATQVFGRSVSFDAQNDPCVRVEAAKVRRALERYYLLRGMADPIEITIPKGRYRPLFTLRSSADARPVHRAAADLIKKPKPLSKAKELDRKPFTFGIRFSAPVGMLLLVIGFAVLAATVDFSSGGKAGVAVDSRAAVYLRDFIDQPDPLAPVGLTSRSFRDEMIFRLVAHRGLTVLLKDPDKQFQSQPLYVLDGTISSYGGVQRATVRLLREADGAVLWMRSYDAASDNVRLSLKNTARVFASEIQETISKDISWSGDSDPN